MAQKKITDYQLISAITDTVNFFVDDLTQNYRATAAQIKEYVLSNNAVTTAVIDALAVTTAKLANGAVTSAKANFTTPTVQRFTSGSGTYTTPAGVKWITVEMVGGGAGGAGAAGTQTGNGGTGGTTTFGSSLLTCTGGNNGSSLGGSPTVNSPAIMLKAFTGQRGGKENYGNTWNYPFGSEGGNSPFGGAGTNSGYSNGIDAIANTGSGGGGGGVNVTANAYGGRGGPAGGYLMAIIPSPSATYSYAVGAGGSPGAAGGSQLYGGGAGGSGVIIVTEYYQ